jgi:hypothetical protein
VHKTVYGNGALSSMHIFKWFKKPERDIRNLGDMHETVTHKVLKIHKQIQKLINW